MDQDIIKEALGSIRSEMKGRLARKLLPKREQPNEVEPKAVVVIHKEEAGEPLAEEHEEESHEAPGLPDVLSKILSKQKE